MNDDGARLLLAASGLYQRGEMSNPCPMHPADGIVSIVKRIAYLERSWASSVELNSMARLLPNHHFLAALPSASPDPLAPLVEAVYITRDSAP